MRGEKQGVAESIRMGRTVTPTTNEIIENETLERERDVEVERQCVGLRTFFKKLDIDRQGAQIRGNSGGRGLTCRRAYDRQESSGARCGPMNAQIPGVPPSLFGRPCVL